MKRIKLTDMAGMGRYIIILWAMILFVTSAGAAVDREPSLDELLQILPTPVPPSNQQSTPANEDVHDGSGADIEADVLQQLSADQPADVLGHAIHQMDQVADRIGHDLDVGIETQRLQESILANLDQVIAAVKKSGMGSGGSASGGEAQPQDSGSALNVGQRGGVSSGDSQGAAGGGSGSKGHLADAQHPQGALQDNRDKWGNLPVRLRDDLMQGINERFSSVYRELTGQYYRRLAQENQQ